MRGAESAGVVVVESFPLLEQLGEATREGGYEGGGVGRSMGEGEITGEGGQEGRGVRGAESVYIVGNQA